MIFLAYLDVIFKLGIQPRGNQTDCIRALLKTDGFLNMILTFLNQDPRIYYDYFFSEGPILQV